MKRIALLLLAAAALVAWVALAAGCSPGRGPYFQPSHRGPRMQTDRIYNPADPRYRDRLSADQEEAE